MNRSSPGGESCACPHHRTASRTIDERGGAWATLLPILACAVCPGCLTTYAKILSALGLGFTLSESQHVLLLSVCVAVSLGVGVREIRQTRRAEPLLLTVLGCAALGISHAMGDSRVWGWTGMALLLGGALWGHRIRFRVRSATSNAGLTPSNG